MQDELKDAVNGFLIGMIVTSLFYLSSGNLYSLIYGIPSTFIFYIYQKSDNQTKNDSQLDLNGRIAMFVFGFVLTVVLLNIIIFSF